MSKQRGRKTFQHPGTKHVVTTGLPTEQTELRGRGYVEQQKVAARTAPARTQAATSGGGSTKK